MTENYKGALDWESVNEFLGLYLFHDGSPHPLTAINKLSSFYHQCAIDSYEKTLNSSPRAIGAAKTILIISTSRDRDILNSLSESNISMRLKRNIIKRFIQEPTIIFKEDFSLEVKGLVVEAMSEN
jgi:hypothetical protein